MAPYFDLTVGPPPTERSSNAIESERDLRHCPASYGSTDDYRMRRQQCPDSIPRYNDDAIEQLRQQFSRYFLLRNDHEFVRYRDDHRGRIGWIRKHDSDSDTYSCARPSEWKCSPAASRSHRHVEHSESGRVADMRWMRQRWWRRDRTGVWVQSGLLNSKLERQLNRFLDSWRTGLYRRVLLHRAASSA